MSLRSFIQLGETINLSMGISISSRLDDSSVISYVVLQQKQGNISVLTSGLCPGDNPSLPSLVNKFLDRGIRVHVNFDTKNILTKALPVSSADDLINNVFPGIDPDKFVFQRAVGIQERYFSLIRKDLVENSAVFNGCRDNIVSVSFGPFIVSALLPFLKDDVLSFSGYQVEAKEGEIGVVGIGNEIDNNTYFVGGENVPSDLLLAYASALNIFLGADCVHLRGLEFIEERKKYAHAMRSVFKVARMSAFTLLAILVTNALVFLWLNEKTSGMEETTRALAIRNSQSVQLHGSLKEAGKAYDAIGWNSPLTPVFFADQLAASVPANVLLETLEIGVINHDVFRRDKLHSFDSHRIAVRGLASDPSALNEWLTHIQAFAWVAQVRNQKYYFDERLRKGVFELSILLK